MIQIYGCEGSGRYSYYEIYFWYLKDLLMLLIALYFKCNKYIIYHEEYAICTNFIFGKYMFSTFIITFKVIVFYFSVMINMRCLGLITKFPVICLSGKYLGQYPCFSVCNRNPDTG